MNPSVDPSANDPLRDGGILIAGEPAERSDWDFAWEALEESVPALRRLAGVPQDPLHHAEGDVQIHTELVCRALTTLPQWRRLPPGDRSLVFAATLMHDISKPDCTKEENGRITSKGHSVRGAQVVRQWAWERWPEACSLEGIRRRELLCGAVRHHGLPLYFMDRPDPLRAVIEASISTRLDWVALLARADVLGRECRDQKELLERVDWFEAFIDEHQCARGPYPFANDYTRVQYFRKNDLPPTAELYDDTRCAVTLMCGLPASGKDHWVARQQLPVVSLDELREQLDIDPSATQGAVANAGRERARVHLRAGEPFIWNATNTTRQLRSTLTGLFHDYGARVRMVYVETSPSQQRARNARRENPVPHEVIDRLRRRFQFPTITEAHHVEVVVS